MGLFSKKKFVFLVFFLLSFTVLSFVRNVKAETCSSTDDCSSLIKQYEEQIGKLQGQASTLKNQIAQFDTQIALTSLKIARTEEQIKMLGGRITQLGDSLDALTKAFNIRAVETYKLSKIENNIVFILSAGNIEDVVTKFHYLQRIQEEDQNLLIRLEQAQTTYEGEKDEQETLQAQLQTQKANLNSQKAAKNSLLSVTKNDEARYQSLLSQAKAQFASFQGFTQSRGGASLLSGQTKCNDGWSGCYYNQRDSEWGNMSLGGTSYLMKDSGCFVTSIAMMASHSGKDIKPSSIASIPAVFTVQGDLIWAPFNVNGTSVSVSSDSKNSLDSYVTNGKPVIAKLHYTYGDHFIVILRKEGDTYYMNDPYLENGYNKPLSAGGYSYSDIVSLRTVSFN